ncbi:MAG TPA: hypothetical protein PLL30_16100 [Candidatus Krumholzibacteria bacterium]|nr:hypothetical protein [Candidatus Krumholzibacteria bacterium]HPD73293.1 hypothetical protein [Candidatus Krumholzibacteria bacterium]HRY42009.1 hypothetical protein [Candidatus Krumholzibacteria bacterium]
MYDTHDIARAIHDLLNPDEFTEDDGFLTEIEGVSTYEEAGVLTQDAGFILRLNDRTEYQITIVRSR